MTAFHDLQGKTVLLTGGANGIGAATVRQLHEQGARVYFCDIDATAGKKLAAEFKTAHFHRVNLVKEQEVQRWIQTVVAAAGEIHALINNAAVDPRIPLEKITQSSWDDLIAKNLRAAMFTCRSAVPHMPQGTAILNVASLTFHTSPIHMSAYVATKAGLIGFTRALARELGPRRIRVNVISPGWIMTERQLQQYVDAPARRLIRKSQCIPDFLQPEDIAEIMLFLVSNTSRAITGQEILADRGWAHS